MIRRARRIRPSALYTALTLGGGLLVVAGVGLVSPPAALVLAGLAVVAIGVAGLLE